MLTGLEQGADSTWRRARDAGAKAGGPLGLMSPSSLDVGERAHDERSVEPTLRLNLCSSGLRQPNARLESTGLRPATQPRSPLGGRFGQFKSQ